MKRKYLQSEIRLRIYYEEDADLIAYLQALEDGVMGERSRILKAALLRGLSNQPSNRAEPAVDLSAIRGIVESAVKAALQQWQGPVPGQGEDDETASLLDGLGTALLVNE